VTQEVFLGGLPDLVSLLRCQFRFDAKGSRVLSMKS
jgi:hypothetical protein